MRGIMDKFKQQLNHTLDNAEERIEEGCNWRMSLVMLVAMSAAAIGMGILESDNNSTKQQEILTPTPITTPDITPSLEAENYLNKNGES